MKIQKIFKIALILCALVVIIYFIIIKLNASGTGDDAPNFRTTLIDGSNFELKDLKGQYVLLDFWASWCAPCRKEIPEMIQFHSQFKEKVTIVSIALEKDASTLTNNSELFNFPWKHQIIEESSFVMLSEIAKLYGVSEIPTKILIAPNGEILEGNSLNSFREIISNH